MTVDLPTLERLSLEFVSQTLRAFANPRLPRPILLTPR